jgi:hypothetical protein
MVEQVKKSSYLSKLRKNISRNYFLGVGKSDIIKVVAMNAERRLRKEGGKPDHPRVLITAHTGKAASLIGKLFGNRR